MTCRRGSQCPCVHSVLLADMSVEDRLTRLTLDLAAPDELAVTALDVPHLEHTTV